MRLLLDTHVLLWALGEPERLPNELYDHIRCWDGGICASAVSAWEIAIKTSLRKLTFPLQRFASSLADAGIEELTISSRHVVQLAALPFHHRDPFDRMLIAQAMAEGMVLVTKDPILASYPVQTLWR